MNNRFLFMQSEDYNAVYDMKNISVLYYDRHDEELYNQDGPITNNYVLLDEFISKYCAYHQLDINIFRKNLLGEPIL